MLFWAGCDLSFAITTASAVHSPQPSSESTAWLNSSRNCWRPATVPLICLESPPAFWQWNKENGGQFASINRPVAGATHDKELPVGRHPLQLYSLGTPNGVKVTVMLEELLALGHSGAEYDAWLIRI